MEELHCIRVTGKGQMKLRPDTTRIIMTLSGVYPDYSDALAHSAQDAEAIKDALVPLGFLRTEFKTQQFHVEPEYEGYDDHGVYKNRLIGYRCRHALKVEFPSDNERLGKVLSVLAHAAAEPELSIGYTVSDPEAAKAQLLERAVEDAKNKAAVLAKAAGVTLLHIQTIDYAWQNTDLSVYPMQRNLLCKAEASADTFDLGIEPDDIEASDTVTVVFTIS